MKKIFIQSEGKALGPSSVEEVRSLITAGWLAKSNLAQYEGEEKWQPLSSMPEFAESGPASPVEPSPQPAAPAPAAPPAEPLNLGPILRTATRVLVLLILLGVVAFVGLYVARHSNEIFKPAVSNEMLRKPPGTPSGTNSATQGQALTAQSTPVATGTVAVVQLAAAPTNAAPASWERASHPEVAAQSAVIATAATRATNAAPAAASRRCVSSKVDPKTTPFGDYDVAVIKTVQKKWFSLLDENAWLKQRTGRVVISFQLLQNGSVSDVKVLQSSGDGIQDYLCQEAVHETKPFPHWPASAIGEKDSREMQFTFQY